MTILLILEQIFYVLYYIHLYLRNLYISGKFVEVKHLINNIIIKLLFYFYIIYNVK